MADGRVIIEIDGDDSKFEKSVSDLGNVATNAMKGVTAAIGAGVAAAGAAMVALGKQAIEAYGEYEQLIGGVETLFKDSAPIVEDYAANAYKTAGLSANDYMASVTSFTASLLQSLDGDTAKAARVADTAITDMADNANKMGSSMESIQNAYQGFAKQNYTMLDNLKLGYGGTKTEMERLLADATELSGIEYDITSLNDVYSAIHVIQTELGITGTTAKEASTTIQGSIASAKAAWENLLVGLADDSQDFDALLTGFIDSVGTVLENLVPRVKIVVGGIGKLFEGLVPQLVNLAPEIADALVDSISATLTQIGGSLGDVLAELLAMLTGVLPEFVDAGVEVVRSLVAGIADNREQLAASAVEIVTALVMGIIDLAPELSDTGAALLMAIADALIEHLPDMAEAAGKVAGKLVASLIESIPELLATGGKLALAIVEGIGNAIMGIGEGLFEPYYKELDAFGKGINELSARQTALTNKVSESAEAYANLVYDTREQSLSLEILTSRLDNLVEKESLSAGEKQELAAIIKTLNESVPELALSYDEETGALNRSVDAIRERIQAQRDQALLEASVERELELYQQLADAQELYAERQEAIDQLRIKLYNAQNARDEALARGNNSRDLWTSIELYKSQINELSEGLTEAQNTVDTLTASYNEAKASTDELAASTETYQDAASDAETATGDLDGALGELGSAADDTAIDIEELQDKIDEYAQYTQNAFSKIEEASAISLAQMKENLLYNQQAIADWTQNLAQLAERGLDEGFLQVLRDMGPEGAATVRLMTEQTDAEFNDFISVWRQGAFQAYTAAVAELSDGVAQARMAGIHFAEGYANGITETIPQVTYSAAQLGQLAISTLRVTQMEKSPSRITRESGVNFALGYAYGMLDELSTVENAAEDVADAAIEPLIDAETPLSTAALALQGILQGLSMETDMQAAAIETSAERIRSAYAAIAPGLTGTSTDYSALMLDAQNTDEFQLAADAREDKLAYLGGSAEDFGYRTNEEILAEWLAAANEETTNPGSWIGPGTGNAVTNNDTDTNITLNYYGDGDETDTEALGRSFGASVVEALRSKGVRY